MTLHEQATSIAMSVMKDGWQWSGVAADGNAVLKIIGLEYENLKQAIPTSIWKMPITEQVGAHIAAILQRFDDEFGWDAPRMPEEQEDTIWTWMATSQVKSLRKAEGL